MGVFLGIDVGTQGTKVVAYDASTKEVVGAAGHALALHEGSDGSREQDPADWIQAICACFSALDRGVLARVEGIGVSGQQHGFVPLDAEGNVLAPAKLWCDTSTSAQCGEIMQAVGGADACIRLAGNPILAGYTASKLPWTRAHRPEAYARMAHILLPHDYVNFWLTGERWMERGDASGTGWLDVRTREWSAPMLAATDATRDLQGCLPPLVDADHLVPIKAEIAALLGLPAHVRVSAGGGDNMMAAIGTGNVIPGVLSMSLGTSGTLFTCADRPCVDPAGRWAAFCDSTGQWLPLVCTMNCTVSTEAIRQLGGFSTQQADAWLADSQPGAGGLMMLPFLNGERTPDLPNGRGSIFGISPGNLTLANLYRAAMEGATYSLRTGYDALVEAGLAFGSIRLTGGGSRSAPWRQIVADVFGLPVEVPQQDEGAAFGAALQSMWAIAVADGAPVTLADIATEHVQMDRTRAATPDRDAAAIHARNYRTFLSHLEAIRPLYAG